MKPTSARIEIYGGRSQDNLILTTTEESDPEAIAPCIGEVFGDHGRLPQRANATLIVAAWNAAQEINPENPIAAAEALSALVQAVEVALIYLEDGAPKTATETLSEAFANVTRGRDEEAA